jgi:hypothetical protein
MRLSWRRFLGRRERPSNPSDAGTREDKLFGARRMRFDAEDERRTREDKERESAERRAGGLGPQGGV